MKIAASCLALAALFVSHTSAETSLTIYNQHFGVVRDVVPLDLQQGVNQVRFADTTAHLEPESVILHDPKGGVSLSILEQNYRSDPVSSGLLLHLNEGKEIEFFVREPNKPDRIVKGKVIRSGYGQSHGRSDALQPVIETEGKLQFSLPGEPRFPALADDTILKPTLDWRIHADKAAKLDAEVCYVTAGMNWEADYNVVAPENGDRMDFTGWITVANGSGKVFKDARIQLIAGDVAKLQDNEISPFAAGTVQFDRGGAKVEEETFDEFHLYSLPLPTTLHDNETKQVEFVRAMGVMTKRIFVYDGTDVNSLRHIGYSREDVRDMENYGIGSSPKVRIIREIVNSEANHLGVPLPRGKIRFYRQDSRGNLQFTGEDRIDHTPKDETLRLNLGNSFDLVGERKRTEFKTDRKVGWLDETFEIKVRNHKKDEAVEIRVIEHLSRWNRWEIRDNSMKFEKLDAQTIEFRVPVKPDEEGKVTYSVHYEWPVPTVPVSGGDPFGAPLPAINP